MKALSPVGAAAVRIDEADSGTARSGRVVVPTWVHVVWLSLLSALLMAGTPDQAANFANCRNALGSEAAAIPREVR